MTLNPEMSTITIKTSRVLLLLCFFFHFGSSSSVHAQDALKKSVDSLLQLVPSEDYEAIADSYWVINKYVTRNAGSRVIELLEYTIDQDSSDVGRMIIYRRLGNYYSRKGDTDKALEIKHAGLELAEKLKDERQILNYYLTLGNAYLYQNKLDEALNYLNRAETLALKEEHQDLLWNAYYHKALLQNVLGDEEGNLVYNEKMWETVKDYPNTSTKRFVLYQLIDVYSQLDFPEKLAEYTELLSELYEEANPNLPQGHMPIKTIFEKRTDPKNIPILQKTIRLSDSLDSMNSMAYSSIALSNTYVKLGQPSKGIPYLERALEKVKSGKKPQILLDLYLKLANHNVAAGDYKQAFNYKTEESILRDSVNSEKMQRNIAELEVKFDTAKKEREIIEQKLVIEKESRTKNQILIGAIGLGLLLLLTYIFFRKRLKDQKTIASQNESIQQQEITDLQQKNKLLALNSMIEGQEAERLRIAKDLHDSLGGLLSTVKAHFTTIQKEIEQLEELNITEKTNGLIDEACLEVRRISHNMMPHALSISGLRGALEDIVENLKEQGYESTLEINSMQDEIESTKEIMIYRLVQEIVSNIRKHAEAKSILIQLLGYQDELNLIIEDDGKGFIYDDAVAKGGLGLKSINSRVEFLDGKIHWDSQPEKGTSITINIPIK